MNTDLAASLVTARTAATHQSVQLAVVKKTHEMETALVHLLDKAVRAAPPPGQGGRVDKLA